MPEYLGLRQDFPHSGHGKKPQEGRRVAVSVGPQNMGIGLADVG